MTARYGEAIHAVIEFADGAVQASKANPLNTPACDCLVAAFPLIGRSRTNATAITPSPLTRARCRTLVRNSLGTAAARWVSRRPQSRLIGLAGRIGQGFDVRVRGGISGPVI